MSTLILIPAYGRDYKSKTALMEDWNGNKDFRVATMMDANDGRYTSVRDIDAFRKEGYKWVNIRYDRLTKVHVIKIP